MADINFHKSATLLVGALLAIEADGDERRETMLARSYARTVDKIYDAIRDVKNEERRK